jgi:hypothetical protein
MPRAHDDLVAEHRSTSAQPTARRNWRRTASRIGAGLSLLALLGLGSTFGWYLRGWVPGGGVGTTTVSVTRPIQIEALAASRGTLPNVLGLGTDEARQAYADAGVDAGSIVVKPVAYVAALNTVVAQQPAAASKIPRRGKAVQLDVAAPASVPPIVGLSADAARTKLAGIGAGATTVVRYESSVAPGAVARSRPAPGEGATPRVTLVVSEAPSSVALSDLTAKASDCATASAQVDGTAVDNALVCSLSGSALTAAYPINDRVTALRGTVVLADGAPANARGVVQVKRGNRVLASLTVSSSPHAVDVALTGGSVVTLSFSSRSARTHPVSIVMRGARLVGARSGIDALAKGSP